MFIDKRLREKSIIRNVQFGFMTGRSTTDAIYVLIPANHRKTEKNRQSLVFIELKKACDRVPQQEV